MAITSRTSRSGGIVVRATGKDANRLFNVMAGRDADAPIRAPRPNPQAEVDAWNAAHQVGIDVDYAEVIGDPTKRFKTRTPAEVLSGHTAVVWLEGKSGCVCISHCTPVVPAASAEKRLHAVSFELPNGVRVATTEVGCDQADAEARAIQYRPGAVIIPRPSDATDVRAAQ